MARGLSVTLTSYASKWLLTYAAFVWPNGISIDENSVGYIGDDPDDDESNNGNTITGPFERGVQVSENSYAEIKANHIKFNQNLFFII